MLLNLGSKEAGHHSFSHLNISVSKNFPLDFHQITELWSYSKWWIFLVVYKAFWNLDRHFEKVTQFVLWSKLLSKGHLEPFSLNYSLTRTLCTQVSINNPFMFPSLTDSSHSQMEQICFTLSMDIKHGMDTWHTWNKMALGVIMWSCVLQQTTLKHSFMWSAVYLIAMM